MRSKTFEWTYRILKSDSLYLIELKQDIRISAEPRHALMPIAKKQAKQDERVAFIGIQVVETM